MTMERRAKTEWQRRRRAEAAIAAGREPHRTGRPPTGRKTPKRHGDRVAQRRRAYARLRHRNGDNGWTVSKHPIMDQALDVARRFVKPDPGVAIFDPLFEDAVAVAALAICAGDEPGAATEAFVRQERGWAYRTAPLFEEAAA
jgi:hypothetical protein